jgi:DNA sulfur modification protein DndD
VILQRLVMVNFRSFFGRHEITFSADDGRALTLIHGENGAGKTTVLNAMYWCLSGRCTPRLSNPNILINNDAYGEDQAASCAVELHFKYEGVEYSCERRISGRTTSLQVKRLISGNHTIVSNPQGVIDSILPSTLVDWFFFDAEAIGELELSGSDDFRKSLRRILGFELVDGLADDLSACQTKLQRDLSNLVKNSELQTLQKRIDEIKHVLPGQRKRLNEVSQLVSTKTKEIENIETELRRQPSSRPLEERRARLESLQRNQQQLKNDLNGQLITLIGESAPAIMALKRAEKLEGQLEIKESKGQLPAPFNEQLVKDLLSEAVCICGRGIHKNSAEEKKIRALLDIASTPLFNARVREVRLLISTMKGVVERYVEQKRRLVSQTENADREIEVAGEELIEIKKQLKGVDDETVRQLQQTRTHYRREYERLVSERALLESQVSENEEELNRTETRYSQLAKQVGHGNAVQKEIAKLEKVSGYLRRTLDAQEKKALNVLSVELHGVLKRYLAKNYEPRIYPKTYKVTMVDNDGKEVGESTGESQVLKFAFISAVVALAARKTVTKVDFLASPTVAPLVLDAPFSALDPEYQRSVAKNLVDQASQIVLLISAAAWSGEDGGKVGEALTPVIGKRYVLISRVEGPRGDKPIKKIKIRGHEISLTEYNAERTESVLREIA